MGWIKADGENFGTGQHVIGPGSCPSSPHADAQILGVHQQSIGMFNVPCPHCGDESVALVPGEDGELHVGSERAWAGKPSGLGGLGGSRVGRFAKYMVGNAIEGKSRAMVQRSTGSSPEQLLNKSKRASNTDAYNPRTQADLGAAYDLNNRISDILEEIDIHEQRIQMYSREPGNEDRVEATKAELHGLRYDLELERKKKRKYVEGRWGIMKAQESLNQSPK